MRCQLTGKHAQVGNNVSHSNRKTKRFFKVNVKSFSIHSAVLGRKFRIKLAVSTLRTLERYGGLDRFLLSAKVDALSPLAVKLKKQIQKRGNELQAQS